MYAYAIGFTEEEMQTKVAKFGGSSLASSGQFRKVADIIKADPSRRFIVASAPGKRDKNDTKVTDLLYSCYNLAVSGDNFEPVLAQIEKRFSDIISELGIDFELDKEIGIIRSHLSDKPEKDYMASRGEYLNSKILAKYLGFEFVDAAGFVSFHRNGKLDNEKTYYNCQEILLNQHHAVIPGFYGALSNGTVHTFSRGGSDVTGSIVAGAMHADIYENWTDVSGMLSADPRIVADPKPIRYISYKELRELSYMGASVLHEDAVFPVRKAGIPINIRNTNRPEDDGTMILPKLEEGMSEGRITGVAGIKGFSVLLIEKSMMNSEVGFGAELLDIFADHGVPFEHMPTGIDTISLVVNKEAFSEKREQILDDIRKRLNPDQLTVEDDIALVAAVGENKVSNIGVAADIFKGLADAGIAVKMIDQGSSKLNIIIGVAEADYEATIRCIYDSLR